MRRFGFALGACLLAAAPAHVHAAEGGDLLIQPMTHIGPGGAGYLADPQPVHVAPQKDGPVPQILSGTTKAVIQCPYPIKPGCFTWSPVKIDVGALGAQIQAAGDTFTNFQNLDLFQDDGGGWHAVITIGVKSPDHPKHWTVMAHAHPTDQAAPGSAPLNWSADTLLGGSFTKPVEGNYDGKYFEDEGRLYLLYVRNTAPPPALRNEIVMQPMRSPTEPDHAPAAVLLKPGDRGGELESERYARTQAKLVEAPYISRIGDKYALVYSSGAYLTPGYKAGVAWSDTLIPPNGAQYRKVIEPDPAGLWGNRSRHDVHYLIQSQQPQWPNFTGDQVIAPGVAAAVKGPAGVWWLFFNGFAPDDMPPGPMGADGTHRRPYFLRLQASIPSGASVARASDADLAGWLKPVSR